jgi:thioredoxin-like negative regulator of GroEL
MSINQNETPFLCYRCQPLGYCLAAVENYKEKIPINDSQISQWVPIRTTIKDACTKFGKKLQHAHDLFHQDEYEQASYMYQDMYETRNDCNEVKIGLAASFYFLKKYEEAASFSLKINLYFNNDFITKFINQCELKSKVELNEIKNKVTADNVFSAEMISKKELVTKYTSL